jgi:transposase
MAKPLISDALWKRIAPLLPRQVPRPRGGRPRLDDRAALSGIVFVLRTGVQWQMLPQEMSCGSGMTCWRRLRDWQAAGVWEAMHRVLLDELGRTGAIDWTRASLDASNVPAKKGASKRSGRTRRTVGGRAANTTSSLTAKASRSRSI